jgi:hypothetical protein
VPASTAPASPRQTKQNGFNAETRIMENSSVTRRRSTQIV